jgi:DNA polymerase I-like protein with 3'-5' exonuclease and polymerase domains
MSLEDMTKRHYIYPYDPDYVEEMSDPDYDAHLDLAVQAGRITREDAVRHVRKEADFGAIRKTFKPVNYGSVYGIGVPKLAREMRVPQYEAKVLLDTYWQRNWSIRKLAEDQIVKKRQGQMWLLNPVSGFWYSLRYDKDRFSTLNQGTGVYVFDTWLKHIRSKRKQMTSQFHDEGVWEIKKGFRAKGEELLRWAMKKTNEELNLNVTIDIDISFGDNYGTIH